MEFPRQDYASGLPSPSPTLGTKFDYYYLFCIYQTDTMTVLEYFSFRLIESVMLPQEKVEVMVQCYITFSARELEPPSNSELIYKVLKSFHH